MINEVAIYVFKWKSWQCHARQHELSGNDRIWQIAIYPGTDGSRIINIDAHVQGFWIAVLYKEGKIIPGNRRSKINGSIQGKAGGRDCSFKMAGRTLNGRHFSGIYIHGCVEISDDQMTVRRCSFYNEIVQIQLADKLMITFQSGNAQLLFFIRGG